MKTKEAIEWIDRNFISKNTNRISEIIELLKRGEKYKELCEKGESDFNILVKRWDKLYEEDKINKKYKKMWEELFDSLEPEGNPDHLGDIGDYNACLFMNNIKQKYFPKPKKKG